VSVNHFSLLCQDKIELLAFIFQFNVFLSMVIIKWFLHTPLSYYILLYLLLYFIVLNNLYCDETSNSVLGQVTFEHFCDVFTS